MKLKIDEVVHLFFADTCIGPIPVGEDGSSYYAHSSDYDPDRCSEWVTRTLVVSTAHLPGAEIESMLKVSRSDRGWKLTKPYNGGILVYVSQAPYQSEFLKELLKIAVENNCDKMMLTFDGPIVEGLKVYDY